MSSIEQLIQPILHSPQLPQVITVLEAKLAAERACREQFYDEMTPDQKIEFIDGEVIMHSPARNRHLVVTGYIFRLLSTYVDVHRIGQVKNEKCLCVFPRNDYEPDVVFFGPEKSAQFEDDTFKFPVPDLVVEVLSQSTEARERGVKFEDFAANQVEEYWIVDADAGLLEQYLLNEGQYQLALKSGPGQLKSRVIAGLIVPIEAIFDEQANLKAIRTYLQS
jgi:Uma2 family endonuclease